MAFDREKTLANAQKQLRKGNYDRAIKEYTKVVEEDPGDIRSKLKLADLLVKVDRFDDALKGYREVAFSYARQDLYEKAAAVYKQAMRIAPEDPVLCTDLGEAYYRLGRLKDAVRVFHKAQRIYKRDGNEAAQRDILERMVRIDPEDVGLRIQLAERSEKDGQREQALELFREAATQLREEGRVDEYVQVLERIIYLDPNRLDMRKEVVRNYLGRGDEKHALKHLQYCFKVAPQDIETLELLGSTFHRLGSTEKSLLVYGELAALYQRLGEQDRAAQAYRTILSIDPNHAMARTFLGHGDEPATREQIQQADPEPVEEEEDALDGIEFLDEDSMTFQEPDPTDQGVQSQGDAFYAFADDAIHDIAEEADFNQLPAYPEAAVGGEHTAAADEISESSLELVEITPVEAELKSDNDQVHQYLTESDVFLKYGLLDRAEDVLTKVIQLEPDNLGGRDQMRKLMERMGDRRGAAHQLVAMASITAENPPVAQNYLQQAAELVEPEILQLLAEGAGLDPALYESHAAPEFINEVSEGLDEISSSIDPHAAMEVEDAGAYEIDLDADYGDFEDYDQSADDLMLPADDLAVDDIEEFDMDDVAMEEVSLGEIDDFSIDEFVDDLESTEGVGEISEGFNLDGADDVDVNVDAVNFDESELAMLNDAGEGIEFDISAEDADMMFDELFGGGGFDSDVEDDSAPSMDLGPSTNNKASNPFGEASLTSTFSGPATNPSIDVAIDVESEMINNSSLELGKTYKDMGLFAEAIDEFRAALDDSDAAPAALFHIALCHIELGETADARTNLTELAQGEYPAQWRARADEKLQEIPA